MNLKKNETGEKCNTSTVVASLVIELHLQQILDVDLGHVVDDVPVQFSKKLQTFKRRLSISYVLVVEQRGGGNFGRLRFAQRDVNFIHRLFE